MVSFQKKDNKFKTLHLATEKRSMLASSYCAHAEAAMATSENVGPWGAAEVGAQASSEPRLQRVCLLVGEKKIGAHVMTM